MKRLFLDTTTAKKAKVTIFKDSKPICENENTSPLVSIDQCLKKAGLHLEDVDEFSAHPGPGSYTGIRVGLAVVNAINFALEKAAKSVEPIYN